MIAGTCLDNNDCESYQLCDYVGFGNWFGNCVTQQILAQSENVKEIGAVPMRLVSAYNIMMQYSFMIITQINMI